MTLNSEERKISEIRDTLDPNILKWAGRVMDEAERLWREEGPADFYDAYLLTDDRAFSAEAALIKWAMQTIGIHQ